MTALERLLPSSPARTQELATLQQIQLVRDGGAIRATKQDADAYVAAKGLVNIYNLSLMEEQYARSAPSCAPRCAIVVDAYTMVAAQTVLGGTSSWGLR